MEIEVSTIIDRPLEVVWDFYAVQHVENHPRWDPDIELGNPTGEPLRVGSVISRRVTRFGTVTEGTMTVVEFDPPTSMKVETHDGPMTILGFARLEGLTEGSTRLTMGGEFPAIDEETADAIRPLIERSVANIKQLIESET
jgi:hypothetical protein